MSVPPGRRTLVATSLIAAAVAVLLIAVTSRPDAARTGGARPAHQQPRGRHAGGPRRPAGRPAIDRRAHAACRGGRRRSRGPRRLRSAASVARAGPRARGARRGKAREPLARSAPEPFPTSRPGPAGAGRPRRRPSRCRSARPRVRWPASRAPSGTGGFLRTPWAPWGRTACSRRSTAVPDPGQDDGRGAVERLGEHLLVGHARQLAVVRSADDLRPVQRPIRDARRVRWAARLPARRGVEYRPTRSGRGRCSATSSADPPTPAARPATNGGPTSRAWVSTRTGSPLIPGCTTWASQNVESRLFVLDYPALRAATPSAPPAGAVVPGQQHFDAVLWAARDHLLRHRGVALFLLVSRAERAPGSPDGHPIRAGVHAGTDLGEPPAVHRVPMGMAGVRHGATGARAGHRAEGEPRDRNRYAAVFRNDHIWIVQRVFGGPSADNARTTVRWAKIHTSGVFVDGGSIEDASLVNPKWYIYPSISVNRRDDVLIGFTQTSATEFPSAAYAFRRGTDPGGLDAGRGRRQERQEVLLQLVQRSEPMGRLQPDAGRSVRRHDAVDDPGIIAAAGRHGQPLRPLEHVVDGDHRGRPRRTGAARAAWGGRPSARPSRCRGRHRPRAACRRPTASRPAARRASRISQTSRQGRRPRRSPEAASRLACTTCASGRRTTSARATRRTKSCCASGRSRPAFQQAWACRPLGRPSHDLERARHGRGTIERPAIEAGSQPGLANLANFSTATPP